MAVTDILKRNPTGLARVAHEAAVRALANAETRRAKAATDLVDAELVQAAAAMGDVDASSALEAATRRVRDARDLVAAFDERILPAARAGLALAESGLANAGREAVYQSADAKRKAAAARLMKEYPDLATRYAELMLAVHDADDAVDHANANLPRDREPLLTVEACVRDSAARPVEVLSNKVADFWFYETGEMVERPERVTPNSADQNTGTYRQPSGNGQMLGQQRCLKRQRRVVVTRPMVPGISGPRLADTPLPPLRYADAALPEPLTRYVAVEDDGQNEAA